MNTGIVAGTFDPVTRGHVHVIRKAVRLVGSLKVAMGINPAKVPYFGPEERKQFMLAVLRTDLTAEEFARTEVVFIEHDLLVHFAHDVGAQYIFRGIRNQADYEAEMSMLRINQRIRPDIETVFIPTTSELADVSSSAIKGLVGFNHWEEAVEKYIHPVVISAFKARVTVSRDA